MLLSLASVVPTFGGLSTVVAPFISPPLSEIRPILSKFVPYTSSWDWNVWLYGTLFLGKAPCCANEGL